MTDEGFLAGLQGKLLGQVALARRALHHLRDGGSITLTGGTFAAPLAGGSLGAPVNTALEGFVRNAAAELPRGLRINLVSPGWITETLQRLGTDPADGTPPPRSPAPTSPSSRAPPRARPCAPEDQPTRRGRSHRRNVGVTGRLAPLRCGPGGVGAGCTRAGAAVGTIGKTAAPAPVRVRTGGASTADARTAAVGTHSTTSTALEVKSDPRPGPARGCRSRAG